MPESPAILLNGRFAHFLFVPPETGRKINMDVTALIAATVEGLGYELVDVERSARGRLLRVFIDNTAPATPQSKRGTGAMITVEDCEKVSRQLTYAMTVEDIDYDRLEVSSPGLDRPLNKAADFQRFEGLEINVKLRAPLGGAHGVRKTFAGIARFPGGKPAMEVEGQIIELDLASVERARLVPVIEF
jgi:ribosome maturation factor RimP